jgi:hypothetical protein
LKNRERLRAFVKQYGIEYTVLIAGEPGDLHDKLPQGVNLNCWPTTFLLGRDGRVRGIHAGFPGYASSALRTEAERDSPLYRSIAGRKSAPFTTEPRTI